MHYIVLGLLFGLIISSFRRDFQLKNILGYSLLATIGALYGNFIMSVFEESMGLENAVLRSLLIISGAVFLCGIKALLTNRKSSAHKQLLPG